MEDDIPIAPSLYSLSNKMDNSLLAVRDINHKHIVVGLEVMMQKKDTYTREEVIEMLKEMQKETAHTNGFFAGHVTQLWVIRTMLGKKIEELGGEGIQVTIV